MSHHKPPGAAWGQLVILVVYVDDPRLDTRRHGNSFPDMTTDTTGLPRRGRVRFVDLEAARAARGLRLVLITALP